MAGKKILTQFALPVGSTSGTVGNGTAGQVLATGGDSASMYWANSGGGVGKYSSYVALKFDSSGTMYDQHADYTFHHQLNTQNIVVAMWAHSISNTAYTVAQRFAGVTADGATVYPGQHLDVGHDVLVISYKADGDMHNDYVTFDFTNWAASEDNLYSKNLFFTVMG